MQTRVFTYDRAFAPYGEMYDNFGATTQLNFTGDTQDFYVAGGLFDTANRELHAGQGRWISPDPAGVSAADFTNPQTLNRYSYVANYPLTTTDPTGLDMSGWGYDTWDPGNPSSSHGGPGSLLDAMVAAFDAVRNGTSLPSPGERYGTDSPFEYEITYTNGSKGPAFTTWAAAAAFVQAQNQGNRRTRKFSTTNGAVSVADGKAAYSAAVDYLRTDPTMKGVVDKFEDGSMPVVFINDGNDRVEGGTLYWDPHSAMTTTSGGTQSPALGLGHEMTHATGRTLGTIIRSLTPDEHYDNREERRVIERFETPAALHLGEGTRTDHSCGSPCLFYVNSATQH